MFKYFILFFVFFISIIHLSSCSKDESSNPENRCDVIAIKDLIQLPCSVKYYTNIGGGMKNVSVSYYIDSGKVKTVNPTTFPFMDSLYFTTRDSVKIIASGVTNDMGYLVVSFYAWKTGTFTSFGSDSCVR